MDSTGLIKDGPAVLKAFADGYNKAAKDFGLATTDTHDQSIAMCCAAGVFAAVGNVVAALSEAGRLLPELPEPWKTFQVFYPAGKVQVYVRPDTTTGEYESYGEGPTIAAALADALKGEDGE